MGLVLTLVELVGLAAVVVGIGLWSLPAALIVGGVITVAACEYAVRRPRPDRPTEPGQRP